MRDIVSPLSGFGSPFGQRRGLSTPTTIPQLLFGADEPGFFYDFDDWSTLFRDVAGTQPVTAPNQGVALVLDKSGRNNHATQATTAARPLTARHPDGGVRNTVDGSERTSTDGGAWITTGFLRYEQFAGKQYVVYSSESAGSFRRAPINPGEYSFSWFWLPQHPDQTMSITRSSGVFAAVVVTIFPDGTLEESTGENRVAVDVLPTGELRISVRTTVTGGSGSRNYFWSISKAGPGESWLTGAQIEENTGVSTPYQNRVSLLDVTEAGKNSIRRLYFNGASHWMQTPTITPNTDKAQVFTGVRKLSEIDAVGVLVESSVAANMNNGAFNIAAPQVFPNRYRLLSRGTVVVPIDLTDEAYTAPVSNILTGLGDISGPSLVFRVDGTQVAQSTGDQGTGNYLAYPVFIGARGGTSLFYNGFIDQLITRFGPNLDTATIEKTEKYISTKSPEVKL